MNSIVKILRIPLGVVAIVMLFFGARYALVDGVVDSIKPTAPGVCRAIAPGLKGLSDVEADSGHGFVFVSAADGVYALKRDDLNAAPVKLAGAASYFHPTGISLYRDANGDESLVAIDAVAGRYAVEIYGLSFDGGTPKLSARTTVQGQLLVAPYDLAAVAPDRFYLGNERVTTTSVGRFAEAYLLWPHDDLLLFNGQRMRIAVQRIAGTHGVAVSPDGRFMYVSDYNDRRVLALSVEPFTGNLTELGSLALPARLNRMSFDEKGALIVAGQTKPGSSQVFRVSLGKDGSPQSYDTLYSDDGGIIRGAVSALSTGGQLFIAAPGKLLVCK